MNIINKFDKNVIHVLCIIKNFLKENKIKGYIVGGAVRDCLLNVKCSDIDICIDCNPINIIKYIPEVKTYKFHNKFQTATVTFQNGVYVDLIRCRDEIYEYNGALPNIIPSDISDDLKRRDFTINAIAYDLDQDKIIDPFNGINDLKNKKLREIRHNSYNEDPTRIFRAIKYSTRYNLKLCDRYEIIHCINQHVFKNISNDRIVKEILLLAKEEKWIQMFKKCCYLGIFKLKHNILGKKNKFISYDNYIVRLINFFLSLNDDKYKKILIENSVLSKDLKCSLKKSYNGSVYDKLKRTTYNFDIYNVLNKCNEYDLILLCFYDIFQFKIINYFKLKMLAKSIKTNYINKIKTNNKEIIGRIVKYINKIQLNCNISLNESYIMANIEEIINEIKYKDTKL